jgi:hypothetical protein
MTKKKSEFDNQTNLHRLRKKSHGSEYYTVKHNLTPTDYCVICGDAFLSIPFVIINSSNEPVCDECAAWYRIPVLQAKNCITEKYHQTEGYTEHESGERYRWIVGTMQKNVLIYILPHFLK